MSNLLLEVFLCTYR